MVFTDVILHSPRLFRSRNQGRFCFKMHCSFGEADRTLSLLKLISATAYPILIKDVKSTPALPTRVISVVDCVCFSPNVRHCSKILNTYYSILTTQSSQISTNFFNSTSEQTRAGPPQKYRPKKLQLQPGSPAVPK